MTVKDVSLVILAGGDSVRMGSSKHLLRFPDGTIIERLVKNPGCAFSEIIVAGRGAISVRSGVRQVEDAMTFRSPLVGILSAMRVAENPSVFVVGCDMPSIKLCLVEYICNLKRSRPACEIIVPVVRSYYEPLCALYSCSLGSRIEKYLLSGERKVTGFFHAVSVFEIPESETRKLDPGLQSFINLNTPGDYRNFRFS